MKLRAAAVFFATLLVTMGCVFLLNQSQEKPGETEGGLYGRIHREYGGIPAE